MVQYVLSLLLLIGGILAFFWLPRIPGFPWRHAAALVLILNGIIFFFLAHGLRKFKPWARAGSAVVSCIGLLAFPFGTLIYGPFLYVLVKSKHLFAPPVAQSLPTEIDRLAA